MADALTVDIEQRFSTGVVIAARFNASMRGGAVVVLFGPSGSGKTTVVRAIAGLDRPDRGVIRFGHDTWLDSENAVFVEPQRRRAGYVFQEAALFPHRTVRGNIEYGLGHLSAAARVTRGQELIDLVGLTEYAERYPGHLSGGQAQRVALARALAPEPRLLLLDEPFASIDAPARVGLRRLLRQSVRRLGIACLVVTHDRTEAIALGDEMAVLAEGRVRQIGPVAEVFRRPANVIVAQSVGVESVLSATVERVQDGLVDLRIGDALLRAADLGLDHQVREVFACIRAEDVTLERSFRGAASARNHLAGHVVLIEAEGPVERITVDCGFPIAALITRQAREEMGLVEGTAVTAAIKATAVHLVPRS
jgi:molybdate transport system ATP-binding protein